MIQVGLTGGICTGKTFVLEIFKKLGCYTLQADELSQKIIFAPDSPVAKAIVDNFGAGILNRATGEIDREAFSRILFEDKAKRDYINKLVHPLVRSEREKLIKEIGKTTVYDIFVYESALMVESGIWRDFDAVVVVFAHADEQIRRLMERNQLFREEAESRIRSQFPLSEKLKVAHFTIDTTGSFEKAEAQTLETYHFLRKRFKLD
ncbi:MAG TPA: dephospho-CoA kinase [Candidatus Aminicenantes bacterium]|nr:dephospho-CoA kinase [Candidatus Aminicenantes bacterium]